VVSVSSRTGKIRSPPRPNSLGTPLFEFQAQKMDSPPRMESFVAGRTPGAVAMTVVTWPLPTDDALAAPELHGKVCQVGAVALACGPVLLPPMPTEPAPQPPRAAAHTDAHVHDNLMRARSALLKRSSSADADVQKTEMQRKAPTAVQSMGVSRLSRSIGARQLSAAQSMGFSRSYPKQNRAPTTDSSAAPKAGSPTPKAAQPATQKPPSAKPPNPDGGLQAAIEAGAWVAEVLGIAPPSEAADVEGHHAVLHAWLRSGELLCELVNKLQFGTSSRVSSSSMPFKQMENISYYIEACAALGVPNQDCFHSVDLFEGKDLRAVVRNIHALGRVAQSLDCFNGPILGAKIAEKKERAATRRATTSPQSVIIECPASQEQEDVDPQGPQTPVRSKTLTAAQSMGVSHLSRPRRSALSIMPSSYLPQIGFSSSYLKRKIGRVKFAADAAEPPSVCSPGRAQRALRRARLSVHLSATQWQKGARTPSDTDPVADPREVAIRYIVRREQEDADLNI